MWPTIPSGTTLRCEHIEDTASLALGDVVAVCPEPGVLLVHRVVGVRHDPRWLTKGDSCAGPDGWMTAAQIVGRVTHCRVGPGWVPVGRIPHPPPRPLRRLLAAAWRRMRGAS